MFTEQFQNLLCTGNPFTHSSAPSVCPPCGVVNTLITSVHRLINTQQAANVCGAKTHIFQPPHTKQKHENIFRLLQHAVSIQTAQIKRVHVQSFFHWHLLLTEKYSSHMSNSVLCVQRNTPFKSCQ